MRIFWMRTVPIFVFFVAVLGFITVEFRNFYELLQSGATNDSVTSSILIRFHLGAPVMDQYFSFLTATICLDFGPSFYSRNFSAFELNLPALTSTAIFSGIIVIVSATIRQIRLSVSISRRFFWLTATIAFILACSGNILASEKYSGFIVFLSIIITFFIMLMHKEHFWFQVILVFLVLLGTGSILELVGVDNFTSLLMSFSKKRDMPSLYCARYLCFVIASFSCLILYYCELVLKKNSLTKFSS